MQKEIAIHSQNESIKKLFPMVAASLAKGLTAYSSGEKTYKASALEFYSQEIFARVSEIDNAFKNLRIAMEYLGKNDYAPSDYNFSEHHAFHAENFLLRLTSVVDRSHLLAGSTMLMENSKIEKLGGNRKIHEKLESFSPKSFDILNEMKKAIDHLRSHRNQVAHQAGFSNSNLCILQAIEGATTESMSITNIMSYEDIKGLVITDSLKEFENVLSTLDGLVTDLINSFSFIYTGLTQEA
ncbi:Cthe_2314 family HEPN domain-containing protein [Pseudomonas sp. DG56-2]|uniref:Cthe_2314 family HEPN domain-containing protein n=1 Tax=Pseudomonas sp. DG56-2 TaxID=2320270 RepID=UPI0010A5FDDE|nr:Cthe_2314 family HEPN domain-containing protein [Pseudomonas sp. DG56-2]